MAKLKLLVDSYEQPQKGDDPRGLRDLQHISKGQVFETVSDAEAKRLKEIGAALDPKEAAEKARADAETQAQALRNQAAALEAEADAAAQVDAGDDLDSLTVPELKERASAAGIEGASDMRKADLVDALSNQPQE